MKTTLSACAALCAAFLFAACDSTPVAPSTLAPVENRSPTAAAAARSGTAPAGAATAGAPQAQVTSVDLARSGAGAAAAGAGGAALLAVPGQRVVYFDFDSFVIREEFQPLLLGHARVLVASRDKRMVVEGHTDERGGREYNLALGQKRAEAVLRSLALLGVPEAQLEAVSYGEERPAVTGHQEDAWVKNRRAELKDR